MSRRDVTSQGASGPFESYYLRKNPRGWPFAHLVLETRNLLCRCGIRRHKCYVGTYGAVYSQWCKSQGGRAETVSEIRDKQVSLCSTSSETVTLTSWLGPKVSKDRARQALSKKYKHPRPAVRVTQLKILKVSPFLKLLGRHSLWFFSVAICRRVLCVRYSCSVSECGHFGI